MHGDGASSSPFHATAMQSPASPSPTLRTVSAILLTVGEAATRLRVSRATVYRLCEEGRLHHVRISTHAIRVLDTAVTAFLVHAG